MRKMSLGFVQVLVLPDDKNIIPGQGQKLGYGVVLHEYYRV